jgi:hypothetical protein
MREAQIEWADGAPESTVSIGPWFASTGGGSWAVFLDGVGPAPAPPRERTDEDRKRLAAAELKRARKNARRLGFARGDGLFLWVGWVGRTRVSVIAQSEPAEDGTGYAGWSIAVGGVCHAWSKPGDHSTFEEIELAALRALPAAIERVKAACR